MLIPKLYEAEERYRRVKAEAESLKQKNHHLQGQINILNNKAKAVSSSYRDLSLYPKQIERLEAEIKILKDKNQLLKNVCHIDLTLIMYIYT